VVLFFELLGAVEFYLLSGSVRNCVKAFSQMLPEETGTLRKWVLSYFRRLLFRPGGLFGWC
jgi:hypothetical protein